VPVAVAPNAADAVSDFTHASEVRQVGHVRKRMGRTLIPIREKAGLQLEPQRAVQETVGPQCNERAEAGRVEPMQPPIAAAFWPVLGSPAALSPWTAGVPASTSRQYHDGPPASPHSTAMRGPMAASRCVF
jgi:hypothetical protein